MKLSYNHLLLNKTEDNLINRPLSFGVPMPRRGAVVLGAPQIDYSSPEVKAKIAAAEEKAIRHAAINAALE